MKRIPFSLALCAAILAACNLAGCGPSRSIKPFAGSWTHTRTNMIFTLSPDGRYSFVDPGIANPGVIGSTTKPETGTVSYDGGDWFIIKINGGGENRLKLSSVGDEMTWKFTNGTSAKFLRNSSRNNRSTPE